MQALLSGAVDIATAIAPEDKATVEGMSGTFVSRLTPNVAFIPFLTVRGNSPVKDVRVRQAINFAINRQLITASVEIRPHEPPVGAFVGGIQRNRLFVTASQSLYALYVNTRGAPIA